MAETGTAQFVEENNLEMGLSVCQQEDFIRSKTQVDSPREWTLHEAVMKEFMTLQLQPQTSSDENPGARYYD